MKSVTHNGREFLFVEVPEDAYDFEIYTNTTESIIGFWISDRLGRLGFAQTGRVPIPPGSYRILCKASEAGEEQAKRIVKGFGKLYFDYTSKIGGLAAHSLTATESIHSLILSLGMEVNQTIILEKLK